MSLTGSNSCSDVGAPTYLSIITATVDSILGVTAIVGNLLVLLAVILDPNRNLRCRFNYFVANLAAADLVMGGLGLPMSVEFHIRESLTSEDFKPYLPRDHVRMNIILISCTASILSFTALTIDRFIAIRDPLGYRTKMTTKQAFIVSILIWFISSGLTVLYVYEGYMNCRFLIANLAVAATLAVLCLNYFKVLRDFKDQADNWNALHDGRGQDNCAKRRALKWQTKITKTFLFMLSLFICCFFPALVCIYVISFCARCSCLFIHWLRDLNGILIRANSSMNPFVFAWRLKRYRAAFAKILRCGKTLPKYGTTSFNLSTSMTNLGFTTSGTYKYNGNESN
ncbi:adrenocorticotropic hormone receptor-like [Stylophora pistillata]|uniref:adrenocorticotropic hormone receptor-like n=1 Tax=Stylophora pistillata TaxID=50429 RepID=UPI000C03D10A|nr:adrenocorticotropic hormone receptor-like [Stylophora pistillata]